MTMNRAELFMKFYGRPLPVPDAPEIHAVRALAAQDEDALLNLFSEEKQFGGRSAIDTAHGRYEGLAAMRRVIPEWYAAFEAVSGEVGIATQIRCGCRSALEFVFHFTKADGSVISIPMACAADLRDGLTRIDELRFYVNCTWLPSYPKYRRPIFSPCETHELRTEMLSGIMPAYMTLVHDQGMAHIPELMTRSESVFFGAYGPQDEFREVTPDMLQQMLGAFSPAQPETEPGAGTQGDSAAEAVGDAAANASGEPAADAMTAEQRAALATVFVGLKKNVMLRMETIIDDGQICCVEWEQLITKTGREERHRLSEPGISFYERAKDGRLKSFRIIDYANTEGLIDWGKTPVSREEAEAINYLGYDVM